MQCKITAQLFKANPYLFWAKGDPQETFLKNPMWTQAKNVGNCVLHCKLRLSECFLAPTLKLCNCGVGGSKEEHMKHLVEDCFLPGLLYVCVHVSLFVLGLLFFNCFTGFALFGPDAAAPCSGKKTASFHTPLTGGKWVKFLHNFDLARVYSGKELVLASILFSLFAVITFGLERRHGSIGFLTGRQIRVLSLVLIDAFIALYGVEPSARYLHYLTTHMCEWKDELSAMGLDMMDFSTVSSEFLQKILRQQFSRATNYHHDAPMQVGARSVRLRLGIHSPLMNPTEIARREQKEFRRHQALFKRHKCTRVFNDWLPERIAGELANNPNPFWSNSNTNHSGMLKDKKISEDDIRDINIEALLPCPFCEILGVETVLKVPTKRKVSQAVPAQPLPAGNRKEPLLAQPPAGKRRNSRATKSKAEATCGSDGDDDEDDDGDYILELDPDYALAALLEGTDSEDGGTGSEDGGSEDESTDDDCIENYAEEED